MSDTPESTEKPNSKLNKRKLADLLPAKAAVETSLGPLYFRHAYTIDWKRFDSDDSRELGRTVMRQLSSRTEDKKDIGPLAEEDLKALNDVDFNALVLAIAKKNGWEEIPAGAGVKELGNAAKARKEQQIDLHKNMLKDMRKSIGLSYAFLDKDPLEKLHEQMAGLVDICNGAMSSSVVANHLPGRSFCNNHAGGQYPSPEHTADTAHRCLDFLGVSFSLIRVEEPQPPAARCAHSGPRPGTVPVRQQG